MQEELRIINEKLDRLGLMSALACKPVLDIKEAALFMGFSRAYVYRLTSQRRIPHYKRNRKLYFKKSDLEDWMLADYVKTVEEIRNEAATYVATHRRRGNRVR